MTIAFIIADDSGYYIWYVLYSLGAGFIYLVSGILMILFVSSK